MLEYYVITVQENSNRITKNVFIKLCKLLYIMNILDFVGKYAESNNIKYIEKPKINEKGPPEYDFFKKSPEEKTYLSQLEKQADELMAK